MGGDPEPGTCMPSILLLKFCMGFLLLAFLDADFLLQSVRRIPAPARGSECRMTLPSEGSRINEEKQLKPGPNLAEAEWIKMVNGVNFFDRGLHHEFFPLIFLPKEMDQNGPKTLYVHPCVAKTKPSEQ